MPGSFGRGAGADDRDRSSELGSIPGGVEKLIIDTQYLRNRYKKLEKGVRGLLASVKELFTP